jgi:urease alpha subunit
MGFTSLISPLISLIGGAFGGAGGGTASSVTPQQAALQKYLTEQQILANNSSFASHGTGLSTMKTFANAGAGIGAEQQLAGIADTNAQAQNAVQQSNLQQLASSAGFGTQGGSFGNTGSGTGGNVNTNPGT